MVLLVVSRVEHTSIAAKLQEYKRLETVRSASLSYLRMQV